MSDHTLLADGRRLDVMLPEADETLSRSQAARLIRVGHVQPNGKTEHKPASKP